MKIIDVSKHNGKIDWEKVKKSGIDGVIIRAGFGRETSQKDSMFEKNYQGAKAVGLHIGSYWYSYADSPADALKEANAFLSVIKNKQFDLPLFFDIEDKIHIKISMTLCTEITNVFCNALEKAGFFTGVYSFDSFFKSHLDSTIQERYSCWVARVENIKPTYCKKYDIHQYSFKGKVDGVSTDVDMNYCYKDFPKIIKSACLNGFFKQTNLCSVSAFISEVSSDKAMYIKSICENIGMKVDIR